MTLAAEEYARYKSALAECENAWKRHVQHYISMRKDMAGTDGENFVAVVENYDAEQLRIEQTMVHIAHCKAMISIKDKADARLPT
jgi:hypothetical protein